MAAGYTLPPLAHQDAMLRALPHQMQLRPEGREPLPYIGQGLQATEYATSMDPPNQAEATLNRNLETDGTPLSDLGRQKRAGDSAGLQIDKETSKTSSAYSMTTDDTPNRK